jgi:adenosylcobyric acid synthase
MKRALMIQGTASHVGKSVLTCAFGRWLRDQGLLVAPFKAQNMSLNSFVTLRGEEIARSQATQADVLGLEATADMNPVLLKPLDGGCQVVVQGHGVGVMSIHEYYAYKPRAWQAITISYDRLAGAHEAIILEGAGSPVEINLKANDLVNMRMASYADAAVVLVADIERGGVFAHLVGTWELLEPQERARVVGFVINKFRGDVALLDSGLDYVRKRTGRPVLGVLPHDSLVQVDEEDSLGLVSATPTAEVDVAVLRLPGISNFTDVAALARAPGVAVRLVSTPDQLHHPDLLILPGTRTTMRALDWLRAAGLAEALHRLAVLPTGPIIMGLCGGYQILGRRIDDPQGVEATASCTEGLGLLEVDTRFEPGKTLTRIDAEVAAANHLGHGCSILGYEVHQGVTSRRDGVPAWLRLRRQPGPTVEDGAVGRDGRIYGTYVHGLFDDARFCRTLVDTLRRRRRLPPLAASDWLSQRDYWAARYRRLGDWVAAHCDLAPLATAMRLPPWKP